VNSLRREKYMHDVHPSGGGKKPRKSTN